MTGIVGRPVHIDDVPVGQYIQTQNRPPAVIWKLLSKEPVKNGDTRVSIRLVSLNGVNPAGFVPIGKELTWIMPAGRCYLLSDFEPDDDPNGWS